MTGERRVVITGLGVVTPIGIGIEAVWEALINRACGVRRLESFDAAGLACRIGAEVPQFKVTDYVPRSYRKSVKVMARDIQLAVAAAYEAVKDAGLNTKCLIDRGEAKGPPNLDLTRFGANIGAGLICADLHELAGALATATDGGGEFSYQRWGDEGMGNLTPLWLLKFLPNMLACHVTIVHDAQAPSNTITCGEASSHLAIGEAFRTVARGDVDVCFCGGAESKTNPMGVVRPQLLGRLVTDCNDVPESACRPFGADRGGAVPGEGGGLLILESLDHAKKRGARIYGEVVGFGASANTNDWGTPDPEGAGLALAMRKALDDAAIGPEDIDLIGAFGSGTVEHDASELAAMNSVFGDRLEQVPAVAIKGSVGTNGAGSGAIDLAVAIKAMQHNSVPPCLNTDPPDDACRFRLNARDPVDAPIQRICSVGYALGGGQNAALIVRRYQE
ncbi:MAG: beta-ketoacyl-[acyl-carrier-protein] synthase family protein [bacterium]|nr:beta-ketoacyl-[acyl-carrier-protein] synthase family protein [bacterium]